jgi:hypothetical protein
MDAKPPLGQFGKRAIAGYPSLQKLTWNPQINLIGLDQPIQVD